MTFHDLKSALHRYERHVVVATLAAVALTSLGCRVEGAELPAPAAWRSYQNAALGVAFDIPEYFVVQEDRGGTLFRFQGGNAVLLRFVDEQDGRGRGLWIDEPPAGATTLGGRAGNRYLYRHHDGPVYSVTEAYVVPHRGKQLGLEFRSQNDGVVRERMLASFRFLDAAATAAGG